MPPSRTSPTACSRSRQPGAYLCRTFAGRPFSWGRAGNRGQDASARLPDGADLKAQSLPALAQHFGKAGPYFHAFARGIDHRPVRPDRIRKSIGAETTFFGIWSSWTTCGRSCRLSSIRSGGGARAPALGGGRWRCRSSTPTSARSPAADHCPTTFKAEGCWSASVSTHWPLRPPTEHGVRLLDLTLSTVTTVDVDPGLQLSLAL